MVCSRISEFAPSSKASLVRTQALGDERIGSAVEVELYFFLHLALELRAAEDGSEPVSDAIQHRRPDGEEKNGQAECVRSPLDSQ